jgi:diphthamide synthase (EF-2-diphthine--ammonia ligase)
MSAPISQTSETFRLELLKRRAAGERIYQIAAAANVRANELSGLATGSIAVRRDDARVLRVAALLGLNPGECFDETVAP